MKNMKTVNVVSAIIIQNNKVFAAQRGYGEFKGKWEFPGGKIKRQETPKAALEREIIEELDTKIEVGELFETVEYDYPNFHLSMQCFFAKVVSGNLILKEHSAAKWFRKSQLNSVDWLSANRELIEKLAKHLEDAAAVD